MVFKYTKDQENTMKEFVDFLGNENEKIMIIQGAAGTGKSTLISHLAKAADAFCEMRNVLLQDSEENFQLRLAATTNPAVAVLEALTGMGAETIHSLLQLKMVNDFKNGGKKLVLKKYAELIRNSLIIIDEGSMIDDDLMDFIYGQTIDCKVLIIGDQYQLASVGQRQTTMEVLQCPKAYMNEIMRNSGIIQQVGQQFRHTVETGIFHPIPLGHKELIHVDGPTFQALIDEEYIKPDWDRSKSRILAWTNNRVLEYSSYVRRLLGMPEEFTEGELVYTNKLISGGKFNRPIDSPVEVTGVGLEYTDDDTGVIGRQIEVDGAHTAFHPKYPQQAKQYLNTLARAKQWDQFHDLNDSWLDLRLPYASTVHKAQGSSYDRVFIDLGDIGLCRHPSDTARLLYVAISRARYQVVLYGQLPAHYGGPI